MIKIIIGIVFLIFSGTCILFSFLISKLSGSKQTNRTYTTGIIDGYVDTEGLLYTPYIKLIDQNGIEQRVSCHATKMNRKDYPVGTQVKVSYKTRYVMGQAFWDVDLENEELKKSSSLSAGKVLTILGVLFLLISVGLIIMGIIG